MFKVNSYAAHSATDDLKPFVIERREVGPKDVHIDIKYSGVCHSDIHQVRSDWGPSMYPIVPGQEIVGRVVSVGSEVIHLVGILKVLWLMSILWLVYQKILILKL